MKTTLNTALSVLAITAFVTGPAAANLPGQELGGAVQSTITDGNISITVDDGIATLFGWTDSQMAANAAKQAALSFDDVESIVDLITVSN